MKQEHLEESLKDLAAIQVFKESEAYDLLIKPLQEKIDSLKYSYDCKTLIEMATLKGERDGLMFVIDLISQYERDGILSQEETQRIENKRVLDTREIDSTDL